MTTLLRFRNRKLELCTEIERISGHQRSFDILSNILVSHLAFSETGLLDLDEKCVLDFGTGNFLSTSVMLKLLGAESVDTFDIRDLVNLKATQDSLAQNAMYLRSIEHLLSDSANARCRWFNRQSNSDKLSFSQSSVRRIVEPRGVAAADDRLADTYDLVYSYNVFEHIPLDEAAQIFAYLRTKLSPTSRLVIYIDYSNHADPVHNPFGHLGDAELKPQENGLGFSHRAFRETIVRAGLKISREKVSQDLAAFNNMGSFEPEHAGEVSALLVVQNV